MGEVIIKQVPPKMFSSTPQAVAKDLTSCHQAPQIMSPSTSKVVTKCLLSCHLVSPKFSPNVFQVATQYQPKSPTDLPSQQKGLSEFLPSITEVVNNYLPTCCREPLKLLPSTSQVVIQYLQSCQTIPAKLLPSSGLPPIVSQVFIKYLSNNSLGKIFFQNCPQEPPSLFPNIQKQSETIVQVS